MMNRPKFEDYKAFVKDGLIIPRLAQYVVDLEKYCDELEATLKCTQDSWWGTMDNLDKHMKALDKACYELAERNDNLNEECWRDLLFENE